MNTMRQNARQAGETAGVQPQRSDHTAALAATAIRLARAATSIHLARRAGLASPDSDGELTAPAACDGETNPARERRA